MTDTPDVTSKPEPAREPFDPHLPALDDDDDARHLDPIDPRRRQVEERRGRPFNAEEP